MADSCGTCRYGTNVEKLTLCKRYPPVAVPHFAGHYSFGSAAPTEDSMPAYWPAVQQDDLCGEFKAKQDAVVEQPIAKPAPTPEPKKVELKPKPTPEPKLIPKSVPNNKNRRSSVRVHK